MRDTGRKRETKTHSPVAAGAHARLLLLLLKVYIIKWPEVFFSFQTVIAPYLFLSKKEVVGPVFLVVK